RLGQAELLEQLPDPLPPPSAGQPVDLGLHLQVLAAARLRVETVLLPHHSDRAAHRLCVAEHVEAGHARLAAVWARERGQDADGRRLAGAVRAEQAKDRSRLDDEAEPVERADAAVVRLPQIRRFDRVHFSCDPSYSSTVETF